MRGSSAHATLLSAPLKLDHFERMCDDTGMMQHARYSIPDRNHGYCVDDVARGLQFLCHLYHRSSSDVNPQIDPAYREKELGLCRTMSIFLGFIGHAWNPQAKRFRNFLGFDRQWLEETGSEDAHGRTLWALATARMLAPLEADRKCAGVLFREGMEGVSDFTSPRAWAFIILACGEIRHNQLLSHACVPVLRDVADGLRRIFSEIIERRGAEQKWLWPEPVVTYANARLPHALLVAGDLLSDQELVETGMKVLTWLFEQQEGERGQLSIIGNRGWLQKDTGTPARFDQQPIEALCLVEAACEAWKIDRNPDWLKLARRAWGWFLGENDLSLPLYDPETGGCYDGLTPEGVNRNQGAESLLAWLISTRVLSTYREKLPEMIG